MTTKKTSSWRWFVRPTNGFSEFTNQVIAEFLGVSQSAIEMVDAEDTKGRPLQLWECTFAQIRQLTGVTQFPIKFEVYKRQGNDGPVGLAPEFFQQHPPKRYRRAGRAIKRHAPKRLSRTATRRPA